MKTNLKSLTVAAAAALIGAVSVSTAFADAGGRTPKPAPDAQLSRAPERPGGDPPYDPGWGPSDLRNPWQPPTGPGDIRDTPDPLPTGPSDYSDAPPPPFDPKRRIAEVPDGCVGGKMIDYSRATGEWKPSKAWTVHVWILDGYGGGAVQRSASTRLDVNGEWTLCATPDDFGKTVLTSYVADNGRLRMEDIRFGEKGWVYWTNQDGLASIPPGHGIYPLGHDMPASETDAGVVLDTFALDTGPETIDGDTNPLYRLGDIMRWGTAMLDKLASKGIEAQRSGFVNGEAAKVPHEIHYPLMAAECDGEMSACYDPASNYVALHPSHADAFTVDHELAHSLVDEYWDYEPGGGTHNKDECSASANVAYSEGIANFIAVWAQNSGFGYKAETDPYNIREASVPSCAYAIGDPDGGNGSHSEVYIAGALWDLHDHDSTDDPTWPTLDTTGMQTSADIVKIVLNNPKPHAPALRWLLQDSWPDYKSWVGTVFGYNNIGNKTPQY